MVKAEVKAVITAMRDVVVNNSVYLGEHCYYHQEDLIKLEIAALSIANEVRIFGFDPQVMQHSDYIKGMFASSERGARIKVMD